MTYTTKQAADLAGVSPATVRNVTTGTYHQHYATFLSPNARPEKGTKRQLDTEDVRLLAYIRQRTAAGMKHREISEALHAGALDSFTWTPEPEPEQEPAARTDRALILAQQATTAITAQLDIARAREEQLTQQLLEAHEEIGRLKGQLEKRRPWWQRLFGNP